MGFTIQLLTDEVLEQYAQLDPQKRSIKVCDYFINSFVYETFFSVIEC